MTTKVIARTAADVMGHPAITVSIDTGLATAARLMIDRNIGCLPVVYGDGMLAGMLTERVLQAQLAGGRAVDSLGFGERTILALYGGNPRGIALAEDALRVLGTRPAREIMIDRPVEVGAGTPLWRVAEIMLREHVSHLAVTEDGRPIGVIARHDLVRALAGERDESKDSSAFYT